MWEVLLGCFVEFPQIRDVNQFRTFKQGNNLHPHHLPSPPISPPSPIQTKPRSLPHSSHKNSQIHSIDWAWVSTSIVFLFLPSMKAMAMLSIESKRVSFEGPSYIYFDEDPCNISCSLYSKRLLLRTIVSILRKR